MITDSLAFGIHKEMSQSTVVVIISITASRPHSHHSLPSVSSVCYQRAAVSSWNVQVWHQLSLSSSTFSIVESISITSSLTSISYQPVEGSITVSSKSVISFISAISSDHKLQRHQLLDVTEIHIEHTHWAFIHIERFRDHQRAFIFRVIMSHALFCFVGSVN